MSSVVVNNASIYSGVSLINRQYFNKKLTVKLDAILVMQIAFFIVEICWVGHLA